MENKNTSKRTEKSLEAERLIKDRKGPTEKQLKKAAGFPPDEKFDK